MHCAISDDGTTASRGGGGEAATVAEKARRHRYDVGTVPPTQHGADGGMAAVLSRTMARQRVGTAAWWQRSGAGGRESTTTAVRVEEKEKG
jgi:hypothetical protein